MNRKLAGMLLSVVAFAGITSACTPSDGVLSATCFPATPPQYSVPSSARLPLPETVSIYIDTSLSTTYYGTSKAPSITGKSPFENLMLWVTTSSIGERATLYGFAENVAPIDGRIVSQIAQGTDNPCRACGFQETPLSNVFQRIVRDDPESLSLVMTDLWFNSTDIQGSGVVALRQSFQGIFSSGRAIGILGFEASYVERVFDLPGAPTLPRGRINSRPFFVVLVGKPALVEQEAARLRREVFEETPDVTVNYAMFSPDIVARPPDMISFIPDLLSSDLPRQQVAKEAIRIRKDEPGLAVDRISFNIPRVLRASTFIEEGDDTRIGPSATLGTDWTYASTPQISEFDISAKSWTNFEGPKRGQCNVEDWTEDDITEALQRTGPSSLQLDLAAPPLISAGNQWYFLSFEVQARGLAERSPATEWLREWSFSRLGNENEPGVAVNLRDPPAFFPSLNLAAFARVMREEAEAQIEGKTVGYSHVFLMADN